MSFRTIMVHVDLGSDNRDLLTAARDLADRCGADVIGIAASLPMVAPFGDGMGSGELVELSREEIENEMNDAAAAFRKVFADADRRATWRSEISFGSPAEYIAHELRAADLLLTGPQVKRRFLDNSRLVEIADLIMRAGRPAVIIPPGARLDLRNVVICWKDTREAQRAASDALPLLKMAGHVVIVAIAAADEREVTASQVADVAAWLARHGISAEARIEVSTGDDADQLARVVKDAGAGLIVAGAYGHNRLREWMFGGVTRDLLLQPAQGVFTSH